VDELMTKYITSVGRNTNMLLGIVIDDRGLVPEADVKRIEAFGKAIKAQYGKPLMQTAGQDSTFTLSVKSPVTIDRMIIQEDISQGERVLEYTVKGKQGDQWIDLASGTNIGHKHIDRFQPVTVREVTLSVTKSKAVPQIKNFAIFEVDGNVSPSPNVQ
jgi:alpha-L-fucosidase